MILKKLDSAEAFTKPTSTTYEYNIEDKNINYAILETIGRFPEEGYALNEICTEQVHVLDGAGAIVVLINGKEVTKGLEKDDVVVISPKEKFYWDGCMKLGVSCTPAWSAKQHKNVEA